MRFDKPAVPRCGPPDVPRREYWNESRPFVTIDPHLTFELDAGQAWSFPRTQLIRFELAARPNRDSPGAATEEKILVLQFHKAKLTVQTDYPQGLLTASLREESPFWFAARGTSQTPILTALNNSYLPGTGNPPTMLSPG